MDIVISLITGFRGDIEIVIEFNHSRYVTNKRQDGKFFKIMASNGFHE